MVKNSSGLAQESVEKGHSSVSLEDELQHWTTVRKEVWKIKKEESNLRTPPKKRKEPFRKKTFFGGHPND